MVEPDETERKLWNGSYLHNKRVIFNEDFTVRLEATGPIMHGAIFYILSRRYKYSGKKLSDGSNRSYSCIAACQMKNMLFSWVISTIAYY